VSSLLPLMNTCAAIKPFFMVESHVRNYLVHLRTRQVESGCCKVGATLCQARPEKGNFLSLNVLGSSVQGITAKK